MPGPRDEALKRIDKKRAEIASLEMQIREAASYIQALEDMLKLLPRDTPGQADGPAIRTELRPGSVVAKARDAIFSAGHSLHITDILKSLGRPMDNISRAAVSGSLSAYVRKNEIFTRPAPNTFGLLEIPEKTQRFVGHQSNLAGPPPDFGLDSDDEEEIEVEDSMGEEDEVISDDDKADIPL